MKTIYILTFLTLLFGCHSSENSSDGTLGITDSRGGITKAEIPPVAEDAMQDSEEGQPIIVQPDKIIKTAEIMFEVSDYRESKKRVDSLVNIWGGYISDENERSSNFRINNTMVIRISNQNFENLINDIGEISTRFDYKRINSTDVTEQYVDIVSRLNTKKEVKKRYEALLEKATKIEDILKIENEIRVIQEEIEAKEGRLRYLDNRVSLSTINLEIYQVLEYKYKPKTEVNFFSRFYKALDKGWKGLLSFLIGVVHIWPLILLVTVGLIIYFRFEKKRGKSNTK